MGESPMPRERHVAFSVLDKRRLRGSVGDIMTLMEIKTEVLPTLTLEERADLARALNTLNSDETDEALWDAQLREDLKAGGPLDFLINKAIAEDERGETEVWP